MTLSEEAKVLLYMLAEEDGILAHATTGEDEDGDTPPVGWEQWGPERRRAYVSGGR